MTASTLPNWQLQRSDNALVLCFSGCWTLANQPPALDKMLADLSSATAGVSLDFTALESWDSLLVSQLLVLQRVCERFGIVLDNTNWPDGLHPLLMLAIAVPPEQQAKNSTMHFQETLFMLARNCWLAVRDALTFFGEMALSCQRLMQRRANFRWQDFWFFVQQAGPGALGIISLVSVLAGVILAYLGAVQLRQFGAQVYVANLVSIGMTREMGALMTAIIMAGRTGAAYAAQLGTMQANEEIDALKMMGINPIDFLALPRTLALIMVMPLLTLYSDVLGMIGGSLIAGSMDIGFMQYINQTQESIGIQQVFAGLFKSVVFAILIAEAGCYWGLKSGRSSTDVGITTTRAVVAALLAIIVADSLINVLYDRLHI